VLLKRIVNCINTKIVDLYTKSGKLERMNEIISKHLPQELAPYTQVSNFSQGVLTLEVSNTAWATQLRFLTPDLLAALRSKEKLFQIASIKVIIKQRSLSKRIKSEKSISATEKSYLLLNQEANQIENPKLKSAFNKLAKSIKERLEK
jgi:hypothetical protein